VTKKAGVPLLLDDAAGIPPIENLKTYAQMGIDLFCFSGGKGLRGPQCSGILPRKKGPDRGGARAVQSVGRERSAAR
jgi:L-seryl-tRNA(Ser) seleniumtransferase